MDAVAQHGSIRKAAEALHIASSALNRRILDLEEDVGSPLFERLPRGVRATAAGELFLAYVRRSLKELRLVEAQIDGLRGLVHGRVRVAVAESVTGRMLPDAIAEYHQRHPGVGFSVTVGGPRELSQALTRDKVDLILTHENVDTAQVIVLAEVPQPLCALVAPEHPLATRKSLRLRECVAYPLAIPDETLAARSLIDAALGGASIRFEPALLSNSIEATKMFARTRGFAMTESTKPKLWTPGDWNAYFGFGTNILVNLLVLTGLLRYVLKMPDEIVFGRILPATGLMLCMSTIYYAWLAYKLAKLIGSQAFQESPRAHAPAIVLALTPHLAAWGKLLIDNSLGAAGTSAHALGLDKLGQVGVLYQGLEVMGGGSILGGLMLGAIAAFVIDRAFAKAAAFAAVAAGMTFLGFMHGEAIGIGQSPLVTIAYLGVAGVLFGCAKLATATAPAAEPHHHGEPEPVAAE